jgi:hypoxanthine phosphoribosyltransferase
MAQTPRRLREIVSAQQLHDRIEELGESLSRDYADRTPVVVVIAEGARRLADALVEQMCGRGIQPEVVVLRASRTRGTALLDVRVQSAEPGAFLGRDVLIVDDIADEGRTLEAVAARVRAAEPRSLKTLVLVSKLGQRKVEIPLDYVGFEIDRGWVVGFGMDLDEEYRDLDHLAVLEEN